MKLNLKKMGIEAEANIEKIIEKTIDIHEKVNWTPKVGQFYLIKY